MTKGVKEARKTIRTGVKMPAPGRRASAVDAPASGDDDEEEEEESEEEEEVESARQAAVGAISRAKQLWGAARDAHAPNVGKPSEPDAWMEVTKGVKEARKTIRTGVKMPAPGRRASAMDASPSPRSNSPPPPPKKQRRRRRRRRLSR